MVAKFLLTNVTRETSTFIVWPQQMCLELIKPSKTVWTVSTRVRLCISVNTNMTLQFSVNVKLLATVRTVIWSSVAVYTTFVSLQSAGSTETLVTQWTLVWFLSRVGCHVVLQISRLTKWLYTSDICTVSLHCEFCCASQADMTLWIVCHKHYTQTVSLLNDFVCVLPAQC